MSTYVLLANFTDQGIRTVKESPMRSAAAGRIMNELGGELKEAYLTFGGYDFVVIAEAPSDEVMAKFLMRIASDGNLRFTTLKAFPSAEYRKLMEEIPS